MLLAWVSNQPFAKDGRSSLVQVDLKIGYGPWADSSMKKPLQYAPWNGEFWFRYRNHLVAYHRKEKKADFAFYRSSEEISLSCLGRSPHILKELLEECRGKYLAKLQGQTLIFEAQGGG